MSWTRFSDDPSRIKKSLEISTFNGRYALNVPGPGINLPMMDDPHVRMQTWGANLTPIGFWDLNSELRGATRPLTHDVIPQKYQEIYKFNAASINASNNTYPVENPFVEESRITHPIWSFRGIDSMYQRWEEPWLNPQDLKTIEKPFMDNLQSRIIEKDRFQR
jgi:hypothetical protein